MAHLTETLRYKPEGCGFDSPSGRNMALGSTQPLTEMSTKNITWWGKGGRCVGLTTLPPCADCLQILGVPTSWNPKGLSRPVMRQLYVFSFMLPACRPTFAGIVCIM